MLAWRPRLLAAQGCTLLACPIAMASRTRHCCRLPGAVLCCPRSSVLVLRQSRLKALEQPRSCPWVSMEDRPVSSSSRYTFDDMMLLCTLIQLLLSPPPCHVHYSRSRSLI